MSSGAEVSGCDVADVRRRALEMYPFFGSVAADVVYEPSERIRTAAGDGKTIYYNPDYLASLTEEEQVFVFAHEFCHIAFNHISRGRGRDPLIWKKATDAVVNQLLKRDGLPIPPGGVDDPEAIAYDAEQFYEILMEHKLAMDLVGGSMEGGAREHDGAQEEPDPGKDAPGLSEDDPHSLWAEAADRGLQEENERAEELLRQLAQMKKLAGAMEQPDLPHSPDDGESEGAGGDLPEDLDPEDLVLLGQTVSRPGNAIRPDGRDVARIGAAPPIIDWRLVLRDTINLGLDWSMLHAVMEDGIVRPVLEELPMPETEIVLDTSWSVDEDLLRSFLRECKNILQHSKIRVGCFDTVFYGFQEIRTVKDIEEMTFDGGGGTDFNAAVEAFSLRVDNRIVFTDGEADMPEQPMDAVWMVYGGEEIRPPGGKVIHITDEQLEELKRR